MASSEDGSEAARTAGALFSWQSDWGDIAWSIKTTSMARADDAVVSEARQVSSPGFELFDIRLGWRFFAKIMGADSRQGERLGHLVFAPK
jgi:hypothetical protein